MEAISRLLYIILFRCGTVMLLWGKTHPLLPPSVLGHRWRWPRSQFVCSVNNILCHTERSCVMWLWPDLSHRQLKQGLSILSGEKKKQEFTVNTPKLRTPIPTLVIESNCCSHHTLLITHSLEAARLSLVLLQECGNLVALILSMLLPPSLTLSHTHALSLSQLLFPFSAYR